MGAAVFDEEKLIEAVMRVRLAGADTVAACHSALEAEFDGLTTAQVKKANSKAMKRAGGVAAPKAEKPTDAAPPSVPSAKSEAKQAKQVKAQATELKQAENAMMDAQRRLKAAKSGGDATAMAVTITGSPEDFIQQITMRAMAGIMDDGDERCLKERVEADIAAIEWVKLAQKAGALTLREDIVALGGELQLTRLKEVRGARNVAAMLACYAPAAKTGVEDSSDYASVDKMVRQTGALSAGGDGMEGELADID